MAGRTPGVCGCRYQTDEKGRTHRIRCEQHPHIDRIPVRPKYQAINPTSILQLFKAVDDTPARAIGLFTYLSGGRINEVTDFTPNRLEALPDRFTVRIKTLKQRRGDNVRKILIPRGDFAKCLEDEMMEIVLDYLKGFKSFDYPFRKWGNMSEYLKRHAELKTEARVRTMSGEYVDKMISKSLHPHFLRHCRATHLHDYYGFDNIQLCRYFGWKNPEMAMRYTSTAEIWQAFSRRAGS
jgi:integrase